MEFSPPPSEAPQQSVAAFSHHAVMGVYDADNVIETHVHKGGFTKSQFRHKNVTCVSLNLAHWSSMRKPFMLPALREARKSLGFVLPVGDNGRNSST